MNLSPNTPEGEVALARLVLRWSRYTVNISRAGDVTLRTPSGRSIAWCGRTDDPDAAANEWLETYPGSTLIDRRRKDRPTNGLAQQ